jgi:hypothetical protein
MPIILPILPSVPLQESTFQIGDGLYTFVFRWNSRANSGRGSWFMDVRDVQGSDAGGTPIFLGAKLVLGALPGHQQAHPLFRDGVFTMRDSEDLGREATLDDIGVRVKLWYFTRAEVVNDVLSRVSGTVRV